MGVVRVTRHILNFDARYHIPGTAEARVAKFCMQVKSASLGMSASIFCHRMVKILNELPLCKI